ncbi:hypothetical protein D3C75_707810 [compost metagenome]
MVKGILDDIPYCLPCPLQVTPNMLPGRSIDLYPFFSAGSYHSAALNSLGNYFRDAVEFLFKDNTARIKTRHFEKRLNQLLHPSNGCRHFFRKHGYCT